MAKRRAVHILLLAWSICWIGCSGGSGDAATGDRVRDRDTTNADTGGDAGETAASGRTDDIADSGPEVDTDSPPAVGSDSDSAAGGYVPPLPPGWPDHFFINVSKQFDAIEQMGIQPDTYFNWRYGPPDDAICARARSGELLVGVVYQQWWVTMDELGLSYSGENDEKLIQSLSNPDFVYAYLEKFRGLLQELHDCGGNAVITLEHDPISFIVREIWRHRNDDPTAVYAAVSGSGHPDALASGAPDNFAGFFQVMDYQRKTVAPNVQLAATLKLWATTVRLNLVDEPADGWIHDDGPARDARLLRNMGVDWDVFAMTYEEGTPQEEAVFLSKARYMAAVAHHMNLRIFNWKIDVSSGDSDPLDQWGHNHMQLTMKYLRYLTTLGYVGCVFGYANKTASHFPDAVECWLREYYLGERPGCEQPLETTGVVPLPAVITL